MKRDLDLQTKILQRLEDAGPNQELRSLEGYSDAEFCYNARQLHRVQPPLIDMIDFAHKGDALACMATGLTPAGHDVLDRAKTEWQRKLKSAGGGAARITFETALRAILDQIMR